MCININICSILCLLFNNICSISSNLRIPRPENISWKPIKQGIVVTTWESNMFKIFISDY